MGQAKQRGTFDQRKATALERELAQRKLFIQAFLAQEARLTPAQKAMKSVQRRRVAAWLGIELQDLSPDHDAGDAQPG